MDDDIITMIWGDNLSQNEIDDIKNQINDFVSSQIANETLALFRPSIPEGMSKANFFIEPLSTSVH
jgi:hypothetical protein